MKKKLALVLAVMLLLSTAPLLVFGASSVSVTYNGNAVVFPDAKPFVDSNNRTLTPLAPIATALGLTYTWDGNSNTATFIRDYTGDSTPYIDKANESHAQNYYVGRETIAFTIGSKNALYSAYFYDDSDTEKKTPITNKSYTKTIEMDTAALLQNSRTYAPIKYLAESLGYSVNWIQASNTVALTPVKEDGGLVSIEILGGNGDSLSFGVFKGRLYSVAGVSKIEFKTAKIGTDNLHYDQLTGKDLTAVQALSNLPYLTGACINEKFPSAKKTKITLYFTVNYYTGLSVPYEYEFEYTYSGGPTYY